MSKYETVRLGDVCTVVTGTTPKSNVAEYWNGEHNWVTPAELSDDSDIIMETERKITSRAIKESSLRLFPAGTVLLSSRAPIGKVAIAGTDMYCNQGFKNLICSQKVYNRYLYHWLKEHKSYLNSLGRGSTFKEISKTIVEEVKIPLPPLPVQHKIATTLDVATENINLRRQKLNEIDNLVKSRFVEMFGDYKTKRNLGDFVEQIRGVSYKPNDLFITPNENSITLLRANNIETGNIVLNDLQYVNISKVNEKQRIRKGDILMCASSGSIAHVGKVALCHNDVINMTFGAFCKLIRCKSGILPQFALAFLQSDEVRGVITGMVGGTNINNMRNEHIENLQIPLPPIALQNRFADFVQAADKSKFEMKEAIKESQLLFKSLISNYFD